MKTKVLALAAPALTLLFASPLAGQLADPDNGSAPAAIRALRLEAGQLAGFDPPRIDGELGDAAWEMAEVADDFTQMEPNPGLPATQRTEARVLYDDRYLYVGMRMFDSEPEAIATQLTRRDGIGAGSSEWVHVLVDGYHDRRTAFRFSLNPSGVQADALHYDDTEEDDNWDAVWEGAARIDAEGWTAEFRIPLSQLRFSETVNGERTWGVNFARLIARNGEQSAWSPILPTVGGLVSQSGVLYGLDALESPRRLEVVPYTVARATRSPEEADNPLWNATRGTVEVGGDLRYGVTSNITLSATFNPDFGQVEADPSEVNLSAFESFFAERRPFFLEGGNIFTFGVGVDDNSGETLFYSRRIGRSPQRSIDLDDGWAVRPEATRILGAAKLSGRTSDGWTIGALNALTASEYARVVEGGGVERRELIEPLTNYSVATLARDFRGGQSALGFMATGTQRRIGGSDVDFLRSAAYGFGGHGRHLFADRTWEARAYLGGSHLRGSERAIDRVQRAAGHYFQRPDADHLTYDPERTTLSGGVANLSLFKVAGSKLRGGVGAHLRTPGLELNDLGFQNEADQALTYLAVGYRQFDPQWIFRSWSVNLNPSVVWTTGGERVSTQLGHSVNFELRNLWNGGWWVGNRFEAVNVAALRGGPAIVAPGGVRYSMWLNSDRRRAITMHANAWGGVEDDSGGWDHGVEVGLTARPSPQLRLTVTPSLQRRHNPWQYISQHEISDGPTRYLFGELDQTTVRVVTRMDYTVNNRLSFQFYAQPFISSGSYASYRRVEDSRAPRFDDRFHSYSAAELLQLPTGRYDVLDPVSGEREFGFDDPDFSFRQLRTNAVVRWEFRPGSAIFFVWSQGRTGEEEYERFDFGRDLDHLRATPATNVFLIKASYWFNP